MWRAIRHGLDGKLIDLDRAEERPAAGGGRAAARWTAPVRGELGIDVALPELNGAQRQRRLLEAGASIDDVYAATVRETRETYAQEAIV